MLFFSLFSETQAAENTAAADVILGDSSETSGLKVVFNAENGQIQSVTFRGKERLIPNDAYMPFDFCQGEKDSRNGQWIAWNHTEFQGLEKCGERTVAARYSVGEWKVELIFFLDSDLEMLGRRMKITWNGGNELKIRAFWWRYPTLAVSEGASLWYPGDFPPQKTPISSLKEKRSKGFDHPSILQLADDCSALLFHNMRDPHADAGGSEFSLKGENGLQISQVYEILGRMKPGDSQELGTAYLWFVPETGDAALAHVHELYAHLGLTVPQDRPAEFQNLLLYSFHPGGWIGSNLQDLGGFSASIPFADRIAETGSNAVWMLPLEDRGIYWPRDYYKFQDGLGTGEEYKALVARLHERGLYVMQDCVPHGGSDKFERAKQHPEWLVYDEDGATFDYWCFDFNWPSWREYMKNVAKHYMKNYGVDGYRIDAVGGSKIPNWNPDIPYERASFSKIQAGFNMQASIREGVKEENPRHGGTLAEVGTDIFGVTSDAVYDFSGCYNVFHAVRFRSAEDFVSNVRQWLYESRLGAVEGLLRLRHSESHDSLRSQLWYGVKPARAVVALTAFIDGIPLLFQGQDVGNLEEYHRIFAVRSALPEMQNARYDYRSVAVPPGVFAAAYEKDGLKSVGLINFNDTPVRFRLAVPDTKTVTNMFRAESQNVSADGTVTVALAPFEYTVFALRIVDFELPTLRPAQPASVPSDIPENSRTLSGSNWKAYINSTTGLLSSFRTDGRELLGNARFSAETDTPAFPVASNDANTLIFVKKYGSVELELTYRVQNDRLALSARWNDAGPRNTCLYFPCASADVWTAGTAEGILRDRLFFRNEKNVDVNSRHGIYWRPLELDVLYDSFYQPLWRDAFLTAENTDAAVTFRFSDTSLPARVRWLNQDRGKKGLVAALSLGASLDAEIPNGFTVEIGPKPVNTSENTSEKIAENTTDAATNSAADSASDSGYTLRPAAGGWFFENEAYTLRLSRTGAIVSFVSKKAGGKQIFESGELYTDYGFDAEKKRYSNMNEVEVWSRAETLADGSVRLHFEGRLRQKDRFGRIPNAVSFVTEYTLNAGDTLTVRSKTEAPTAGKTPSAFLAWMMTSPSIDGFTFRTADGTVLSEGNPLTASGRSFETRSNPAAFPASLDFTSNGTPLLSVTDFSGDRPQNVFADRKNFFICFYDGNLGENAPTVQNYVWKFQVK